MQTERGVHTEPPSTAYLSNIIHPALHIPIYPLQRFDRKNFLLLKIDDEEYYEGYYREAISSSGAKYQRYILSEQGMPESIESIPQLVSNELTVIPNVIDESFKEHQLKSFEDKVFCIVHKLGMSLIVTFYSCFRFLIVQ